MWGGVGDCEIGTCVVVAECNSADSRTVKLAPIHKLMAVVVNVV